MKRTLMINLVIVFVLSIAISANAQHLVGQAVFVDIRDFPEFIFGRGGSEGHSGAYIQLNFGVSGWDSIEVLEAKATHVASGFQVTLREDTACLKNYPPQWNMDANYYINLRAEDGWMTGEWEFVFSYREAGRKKTETVRVAVPRFNFPPIPTGIHIGEYLGQKYLVWNRIGDPGTSGKHVEYRVRHFNPSLPCVDEELVIKGPLTSPPSTYDLWSGNRIAVPLPSGWAPGDRISIENRVYDDNYSDTGPGPYRWDRARKDFILR